MLNSQARITKSPFSLHKEEMEIVISRSAQLLTIPSTKKAMEKASQCLYPTYTHSTQCTTVSS